MRGDVRVRGHVRVSPDAVRLVATGIVPLMRPAMAPGEAKECHGSHTRGAENERENVEIHLSRAGHNALSRLA
jgi:hypothetical protein